MTVQIDFSFKFTFHNCVLFSFPFISGPSHEVGKNEKHAGFVWAENIPKHLAVPQNPVKIILFITFCWVNCILSLALSPRGLFFLLDGNICGLKALITKHFLSTIQVLAFPVNRNLFDCSPATSRRLTARSHSQELGVECWQGRMRGVSVGAISPGHSTSPVQALDRTHFRRGPWCGTLPPRMPSEEHRVNFLHIFPQ